MAARLKYFQGYRKGSLTIKERGKGYIIWICDCGNEFTTDSNAANNHQKSCGCLSKKRKKTFLTSKEITILNFHKDRVYSPDQMARMFEMTLEGINKIIHGKK